MKINLGKCKVVRFTRARVKILLDYSLCDQEIPEESSSKYLRIILRSDLIWVEQVNFTAHKACKALRFATRILKRVNRKTKV